MKHKIIQIFLLTVIITLSSIKASGQNAAALAAADTAKFSASNQNGWQLYNSYVAAAGADSVQLELILRHDNPVNWATSLLVGKIKQSSFYPQNIRTIPFSLNGALFEMKVEQNGKCYLKLISGSLPAGSEVVVPVKIFYRK